MTFPEAEDLAQTPVDTRPLTPQGQSHHIQLDGIRAIAVLLVMIEHYIPQTERIVEVGTVGVRVFFVLSGFLITGILLRARADAETDGSSKARVLRNFYLRRFLRIFPLFYAVLLITEILRFPPVRASFWWHFSYLSNVLMFRMGTSFDSVTHLWSLAVEEQFYIIWPWLILYLADRWIQRMILLAIAIGPLFRWAILLHGGNGWQASVLTPACLDALGLGALLAFTSQSSDNSNKLRLVTGCLYLGIPLFLIAVLGALLHPCDWWVVPFDLSIALWSVPLINRAYNEFPGHVGRFLSLPLLTYLGLISYGIYILHNFVGGFAVRVLHFAGIRHPSEYSRALCMTIITIIFAAISWQWFEKPINLMKRHFPYRVRSAD